MKPAQMLRTWSDEEMALLADLVVAGETNAAIAERLGRSETAVELRRRRVLCPVDGNKADLPLHKSPRVGRVCPKCGGSVVVIYADEAPSCLSCGLVPIVTRGAAESIAYLTALETQELMSNGGVRRGKAPAHGGVRL